MNAEVINCSNTADVGNDIQTCNGLLTPPQRYKFLVSPLSPFQSQTILQRFNITRPFNYIGKPLFLFSRRPFFNSNCNLFLGIV